MEKITSWRWRPAGQKQREDSYYYNDGFVIVVRGNDNPADSEDKIKAEDVMLAYSARSYDKLQTHSQHTYDFLKARGY